MKKERLIIIGNGFDLAHNYKTRYSDFQASEPYKTSEIYTYYNDYFDSGIDIFWNDFEKSVNCTIENYIKKNLFKSTKIDEYEKWMRAILFAVDSVKGYLIDYLYKETHGRNADADRVYLTNISRFLNAEAEIINFNYTNTLERYGCKPFYVHGSLEDNYIVLGYDYRSDSDLAGVSPKKTWKEFQRTVLALIRFIRNSGNDIEFDSYYPVILQAVTDKFSGKGYEYGSITGKPCAELIDSFMTSYDDISDVGFYKYLDCKNIKTLVIMGHSLDSDDFLLKRMIKRCNGIKTVVLFSFPEEATDSLKHKKSILEEYAPSLFCCILSSSDASRQICGEASDDKRMLLIRLKRSVFGAWEKESVIR